MSRARHKMRASGGGLSSEPKWNAGGDQNAAKEAEEKKKGGRVHAKAEGDKAKDRADKRARGGHVKKKDAERKDGGAVEERKRGGSVDGDAVHKSVKQHSMLHKGRARGGRIGANLTPLSTAARVKHTTPGETPEEGVLDEAKSNKSIKG